MSSWTDQDRSEAEAIAARTLAGVGIDDRMRSDYTDGALHVRKESTAQERDSVFKTPRGRAASRQHEKG